MVEAAKKTEKKVEENHIGAARHHLKLKVLHEKDADDTMDEILRLERKRVYSGLLLEPENFSKHPTCLPMQRSMCRSKFQTKAKS
ncbi:unnamed protein product [Arabidopsis halleri]